MMLPATPRSTRAPEPEPLWLKLAPIVFLLLWSGGYSAAKIALEYSEPIFMLVLRYALVLALLLPAWAILRPPLPATRQALGHLVVVGILIQGLYFGATNLAIHLGVSAAVLGIVLALQPILVAVLAPWILREFANRLGWIGLSLGLAGAVVAILAKAGIGGTTTEGVLAAIISLLLITAGTLYEKRFGSGHHPVVANGIQCGVGLLLALPLALALETGRVDVTPAFLGALAYLAIGNSIISMTLLFAMIRAGAAARASSLMFLVPAVSAFFAWWILGEPMPLGAWLGMALAAVGVGLVRRRG